MSELESSKGLSRTGLITSDELDHLPFVSQRDFSPTPYTESNWEVIGDRIEERSFIPLELNIVQSEVSQPDPMFEVFSQGLAGREESFLHGGGKKHVHSTGEATEHSLSESQLQALELEWQEKLEAARKESFEKGVQEAEVKIAEHYESLSGRLKAITDAIYEQWSGLAAVLEREAVDLALQVSKKILATTADAKPEYILQVIREGLRELGAAKPVRIRVSNDDFEFLNVIGLPVELSTEELGVTYVSDESIKSGCVIETNFGEVDLVLERMWNEVRDLIYQSEGK